MNITFVEMVLKEFEKSRCIVYDLIGKRAVCGDVDHFYYFPKENQLILIMNETYREVIQGKKLISFFPEIIIKSSLDEKVSLVQYEKGETITFSLERFGFEVIIFSEKKAKEFMIERGKEMPFLKELIDLQKRVHLS